MSSLATRHLPFPHQKRSLALKPDLWKDEATNITPEKSSKAPVTSTATPAPWEAWEGPSHRAQSASRVHLRYGGFLRPDIMHQDPFYALSELFSLLSCAESQVLDVIENGLTRDSLLVIQEDDLKESVRSRQATQAQNDLVHARQMLNTRMSSLSSVRNFFEQHHISSDSYYSWPQCTEARHQRESHALTKALQLDFDHLYHRASTLHSRCESTMTLAMNRASIAEARRSIRQGDILGRFTALAFVFVPATTVASIFGTNFVELGTGTLGIWLYFAVTVPLSCLTFMFLYDGWRKLWRLAKRLYDHVHADSNRR